MRLRLLGICLAFLPLLSSGCPVTNPQLVPEECVGNTPPVIGNLEVNSSAIADTDSWAMCLHVDWQDPGLDEAGNRGSDAPNMFGALVSLEVEGYSTPGIWLDEASAPEGATEGEVNVYVCLEDAKEDEQVEFALRLRDRCNAASNSKTGTYVLGGGAGEPHQVENPEAGANGCPFPEGLQICGGE
ncbi:MAG: hypothetical protein KDA24_06065 [Deltaproteobacteria bacterium]|nr:hypothetical protein [Deltaproteobacteria bacterium]